MDDYGISDIKSEAGVVASLVFHPEFSFYSEQLTPHHFADSSNGYLYYAISTLAQQGVEQIDAYNIVHVLDLKSSTKGKLSISAVNDFICNASAIARNTIDEYNMIADAVLKSAFRRDAYRKLGECQQLCKQDNIPDIEQKIYAAMDDVMLNYCTKNEMPLYRDVIDQEWEKIKARQNGETPAIEFPFPALNEYVVMEPGEVVCFTGAAKSGKSAMLLTCTVDMLKHNRSVLYLDSELSTRLFTMRILSHLTKIPFSQIRSGNYSPDDELKITQAREWLKTRKFMHLYLPVFDENTMYLAAKRAKHLIDIDCIVVDYLKSTSSSDEAFAVYAEMGRIADTLKNRIAGDLGLMGLTAAQATSTGKIADSARIARSVSTVVSITDKSFEEMQENSASGHDYGNKKLRVVFNRNGNQMGDNEWIDMKFDGPTITYEQAKEQHELIQPF